MQYELKTQKIRNFYNQTYLDKWESHNFAIREDHLCSDALDIRLKQIQSANYKCHIGSLNCKEDTQICGGITNQSTILQFNRSGNFHYRDHLGKYHCREANTQAFFDPSKGSIDRVFFKGQKESFIKVFLFPKAMEKIGEYGLDWELLSNTFSNSWGNYVYTSPEVSRILDEITNAPEFGKLASMYFDTKIQELLVKCFVELDSKNQINSSYNRIINRVYSYLIANYNQQISLNLLSQKFGISSTMLKKHYKQNYGCSIHQFVMQQRLKNAEKMLLNSDFNISEIAYETGFSHPSHFVAVFKKYQGCTPGEYRSPPQQNRQYPPQNPSKRN